MPDAETDVTVSGVDLERLARFDEARCRGEKTGEDQCSDVHLRSP